MKKFFAALVAAVTIGVSSTTFAAVSFIDVPAGHWAYKSVAQMADAGIIEDSFGDGTFRGDRNVTRSEMARMASNLLLKVSPKSEADAKKIIETWSKNGNNAIERYEVATILTDVYKKVHKGDLPATPQAFKDVPDTEKASKAVNLMAALEVMEGYGDGTFRGFKTMTRYEAALLIRTFYGRLSK